MILTFKEFFEKSSKRQNFDLLKEKFLLNKRNHHLEEDVRITKNDLITNRQENILCQIHFKNDKFF